MIDEQTVKKIATLAHLELKAAEVRKYTRQLEQIVRYFDRLQALDTEQVPPYEPLRTRHAAPAEDSIEASLPIEAVLKNAPRRYKDFFRVPRVIKDRPK